uniref:Rab-GAP TBC domain-containing protein n=1 Tax=Syphacia muris TaxID=451379 RepID=A0A0N5AG51_9BILA
MKSVPSTPGIPLLQNLSSGDSRSPLSRALDRSLNLKCNRMLSFLDEHKDSLHLYVSELRHFATSPGGLILDDIRAIVWPVLASALIKDNHPQNDFASSASVSDSDFESALSTISDEDDDGDDNDPATPLIGCETDEAPLLKLKAHVEWNQVELDVNRTVARFPPNISDANRKELQNELTPLIVRILCDCPHYLTKTLEDSVLKELALMYIMLWKEDAELEKSMRSVELGALFALSWPLTWFSHSLHHYEQIVLCFDLFLAAHPLMPVYLSSAFVLWRGSTLLTKPQEMPIYHHFLNILPDEVPIQALISDAQALYRMMPPSVLRGMLLEKYRSFLVTKAERPPLPKTSLRKWLAAGTATAAIYLLSRYWLF